MKNSIISVALLVAGVSNAWAASSVDVAVTGAITPSACAPVLSAGGVVDHGKISLKDLTSGRPTALPAATLQIKVSCAAATLFAVKATDNRRGTAADQGTGDLSIFGLGIVNGVKLGWYSLAMDNALGDGVPKAVIESIDGTTWLDAPGESQIWQPDWMRALNATPGGVAAPLPVQIMDADIIVKTHIIRRESIPTGQEVPIDGSATLDIVYL